MIPDTTTGSTETAAASRLAWAADAKVVGSKILPSEMLCFEFVRFAQRAAKSKTTPLSKSEIGKWIRTPCCACFAVNAALMSKTFGRIIYSTTTLAVILGCSEQKYEYVPGLVGVNENLSSVSSAFDLNRLSLLTTVCGMSSRFFQVIRVPVFTVTVTGVKLKLSIVISPPDAPPSCEAAKTPRGAASIAAASNRPAAKV